MKGSINTLISVHSILPVALTTEVLGGIQTVLRKLDLRRDVQRGYSASAVDPLAKMSECAFEYRKGHVGTGHTCKTRAKIVVTVTTCSRGGLRTRRDRMLSKFYIYSVIIRTTALEASLSGDTALLVHPDSGRDANAVRLTPKLSIKRRRRRRRRGQRRCSFGRIARCYRRFMH